MTGGERMSQKAKRHESKQNDGLGEPWDQDRRATLALKIYIYSISALAPYSNFQISK